jgi:transglutaminase-like putative cysteine protease
VAVGLPLAAVFASALPVALKLLLNAGLPWTLLACGIGVKIGLAATAARTEGRLGSSFRALSALFSLLLAAAVLTGILITPYSAYAIWFEGVKAGTPQGVVSNLFVLLALLLSSSLASTFLRSEILLPLYLEALVATGLFALVRQTPPWYAGLVGLLAAGTLLLSFRYAPKGHRLHNQLFFAALLLPILGVSLLPLRFGTPRGSYVVDERLHPGLRQAVVALFPRFPLLYGIPGYGYSHSVKRLGGTPTLSEAVLFEIQAPSELRNRESLYLRTGSYDLYDGSSWSRSPALLQPPADEGFLLSQGEQPPPGSWRITLRAEYYSLLPYTLDALAILLPGSAEGVKVSGSFASGYELADPLRGGQSLYLLRGASPLREEPSLSPEAREAYLQLPRGVSQRLRDLAAGLADPGGDALGTLRRIESFLAGFTYNLQVGRTPPQDDFVEHFLFEQKEGYCVHFASAFVLLARLCGLPARYTTGFLTHVGLDPEEMPFRQGSSTTTLTGLSAHAWAEVWLPGQGWITWEATSAVNPNYYRELEGRWLYTLGWRDNRLTSRQLREVLGRQLASPSPAQGRRPLRLRWRTLIPVAAAVLLALLGGWLLRGRLPLWLSALRSERRLALVLIGRIGRSQRRHGLPSPAEVGWVRWSATLGERLAGLQGGRSGGEGDLRTKRRVLRLRAVILRISYSEHPFRPLDLRFLRLFYLRYCRRPRPAGSRASRGRNRELRRGGRAA